MIDKIIIKIRLKKYLKGEKNELTKIPTFKLLKMEINNSNIKLSLINKLKKLNIYHLQK